MAKKKYVDAQELLDNAYWDKEGEGVVSADFIRSRPAADVAPVVHAHWITGVSTYEAGLVMCSACKSEYYIDDLGTGDIQARYCPHCGAKMDGD